MWTEVYKTNSVKFIVKKLNQDLKTEEIVDTFPQMVLRILVTYRE